MELNELMTLLEGRRSYRRFDEEQTERCYTAEELTAALMAAGFGDVHFYGSTTMDAPDEKTERWFVTARCKK